MSNVVKTDKISASNGSSISVSSNTLTNGVDPVNPQDIATKAYVDSQAGGGGASTALDNLASVAVNTDLNPGNNGQRSLGVVGFSWKNILIENQIRDSLDVSAMDVFSRELMDTNGVAGANIDSRSLLDTTGSPVLIWSTGNVASSDAHIKSTQTTAPTTTTNAHAGGGASSSVSNATDNAGNLSLTLGTITLSSGEQVKVNFHAAYGVAPIVQLMPTNAAAVNNDIIFGVYITSTTTYFSVNFATAGTALAALTWNYIVIETQA